MTGGAEAGAGGVLGCNDVAGKGTADAQGCAVGVDGPVTAVAALT